MRVRARGALFILVTALASYQLAGVASAANGTITGAVTGPGGAVTTGQVTVHYWATSTQGSAPIFVDGSGNYAASVAPGTYRLQFFAAPFSGLATAWYGPGGTAVGTYEQAAPVTVGDGATVAVPMTMPAGNTISGTITGPGGVAAGAGLVGIEIRSASSGETAPPLFGAVNGSGGSYAVALAPGSYRLKFRARATSGLATGWWSAGGPTTFSGAGVVVLGGGAAPPAVANVSLAAGGEISGVVTLPPGASYTGLSAAAYPANVVVPGVPFEGVPIAPNGSYTLAGLPLGSWKVSVSAPAGAPVQGGFVGADGFVASGPNTAVSIPLTGLAPTAVRNVTLRAITVAGTVRQQSGTPVGAGQMVVIAQDASLPSPGGTPFVAPTSATGTYGLALPDGAYKLRFRAQPPATFAGGWWTPTGLVPTYAEAVAITIAGGVQQVVDATVQPGGVIQGSVGPLPIAANQVLAIVYQASTTAPDAANLVDTVPVTTTGTYATTGLPAGDYKLVFSVTGGSLRTSVAGPDNSPVFTWAEAATITVAAPGSTLYNITLPPVTVPSAPTGVSGMAGNTQAVVSWSPPADDGGRPVTSYEVTTLQTGAVTTVPATSLSATITGLTNWSGYTFTVRAVNAVGSSPASAVSPVVIPSPATVRGTVTRAASGLPVGLDAVTVDAYPADHAGQGNGPAVRQNRTAADGTYWLDLAPGDYRLRFRGNPGSGVATAWWSAAGPVATFAGSDVLTIPAAGPVVTADLALAPGGQIQGVVAPGPFATNEVTVLAVDGDLPLPGPVVPVAVAVVQANGSYVVSGLPYDTYKVIFATQGGRVLSALAGPGGTPGTLESFQVFEVGAAAPTHSYGITLHLNLPPAAPSAVTATPGNGSATVTWVAPPANGGPPVTTYEVTSSPGGATVTVPAGQTSAVVTGLTNEQGYTFTVRAISSAGTGPASAGSAPVVPTAVNLRGTIGRQPGGAPVGALQVVVDAYTVASGGSGMPVEQVESQASGGYGLELAPGTYKLRYRGRVGSGVANGWWSATGPVATFAEAGTITVPSSGSVVADIVLDRGGEITGVVGPGPFVAGEVTVFVIPESQVTGPDVQLTIVASAPVSTTGSYTVAGVPLGRFKLIFGVATGTLGYLSALAGPGGVPAASNDGAAVVELTAGSPIVTFDMTLWRRLAPLAPTAVAVAGGNGSATVSWTAPATNGGPPVTSYVVTVVETGATWTIAGSSLSGVVTGLANGSTYTFSVVAVNAVGSSEAASSPTVRITPAGSPPGPGGNGPPGPGGNGPPGLGGNGPPGLGGNGPPGRQ